MKIKLLVLTILLGSQGFLFGMGGPGATREKTAEAASVAQSQVPTLLELTMDPIVKALEKALIAHLRSGKYIVSFVTREIAKKLPPSLFVPVVIRLALKGENLTIRQKLNLLKSVALSPYIEESDRRSLNKLRRVLAYIFNGALNYKGDLTKKYFKISQKSGYGYDRLYMGNILFLAIARNDLILLKLLLDAGANINVLTKAPPKGTPPREASLFNPGEGLIYFIASQNNIDALRLIIESGAELNKKDLTKALSSAIIDNNIDMLDILINAGANIDYIHYLDTFGLTPLMRAVLISNKEIVQFLIKAGADINKKIKSGPRGSEVIRTALDGAIETGNKEIINILRQNGAKRASELEQQGK